jgi:hypothetical protein
MSAFGFWCTGGTRELAIRRLRSLENPMRQLDASERYRCIAERFEAQHGSAATFDRVMPLIRPSHRQRTRTEEAIQLCKLMLHKVFLD